jgi:protocatechuate 3,4-dioxygenase beta subunit
MMQERPEIGDKKMIERTANLGRRNFLQFAARAAVVLPVAGLGAAALSGCGRSGSSFAQPSPAGSPTSWNTTIVSPDEPGEPLTISGTIYAPDGRTPLEGITLWVYHTDATGHYSPIGAGAHDNRITRLHGVMQTNREGHYEFHTIKPAPYPGHTNPAHIHAYVSGPDYPEYWIDSYLFEGDPFITDEDRRKAGKGNFSSILKLSRDKDGTWRGVRDIVIERCSRNCTSR